MPNKTKTIKINGLKCPRCHDEIYSMHRHDFRWCSCHYCFIDGGRDYLRYGFGDYENLPDYKEPPTDCTMEIKV